MRIQVKNWQMNLQMVCNKKIITSDMKSDMEIKKRLHNICQMNQSDISFLYNLLGKLFYP